MFAISSIARKQLLKSIVSCCLHYHDNGCLGTSGVCGTKTAKTLFVEGAATVNSSRLGVL
jgi:hypothetical protein